MLCGVVHACCNTILEWHFASSDVCGAFKALVVQLFDRRPRCLRGAAAAFESCAEDGGNSTELVHEFELRISLHVLTKATAKDSLKQQSR